jgi:stage II sporulation protein D
MFSFLGTFSMILALSLWPFGTGRDGAEIKKSSYTMPSPEQAKWIRIALATNERSIKIGADGPFVLKDGQNHILLSAPKLAPVTVKLNKDGTFQFGAQVFHAKPLIFETRGGNFRIEKGIYPQTIILQEENAGRLTAINRILVEEYLKGVLPHEVNPNWHMDALKSQAVSARTYAIFKAIENKDKTYDLTRDVLSQVYGGKGSRSPTTDQAVDETRGQVLNYNGKIFPGYFHSTCGGTTTHAEYLWDVEPHPALKGVTCNFCVTSKHYRWDTEIPVKEIETRLQKNGVKITGLSDIEIGEKDASGRAKNFILHYAGGKVKVHSNDFRLWVSPMKLKSTLIKIIERHGNKFYFRGRGWGHGVGLCQYGSKQLAELGYTYTQILKFYYPDSDITKLDL